MADNLTTQSATPATIPASTVIATDDAGAAGHVQVVKLAISTDGSATPLTANNTDGLLVNLGSNNDVTISDGGNTITVDGTVSVTGVATAANQSTANTALAAIQTAVEILDNTVSGNELQVDVLTMPTVTVNAHAVTNAGTFAVQVDGSALTSLQLLDDTVATDGSATPTKGILMAGQDGTNAQTVKTDSDGNLQVDIVSAPTISVDDANSTLSVDDGNSSLTVDNAALSVTGGGVQASALRVTIASDSSGLLSVDDNGSSLTVDNSHLSALGGTISGTEIQVDVVAALPAGTNNIGDVDILSIAAGDNNIGNVDIASIAAGDNNIGNVDVVTLPALPAGTNNIGDVDVLSVVPGTGATNLGKAEDAQHGSGDVGVMALAVRQDSHADLGADGDYVPLTVDADGGLRVTIVAGAGSGGTAAADDADFTDGTTQGTPAMGVYEGTPSTVTDGDLGVVGITETRALKVQAQANSGVDIGDVTINNATLAVTQSGTWDEVGINDSGNSITVDNGGTFAVQESGAALTALQLIDDTVKAEDVGSQAADKGIAILAVRNDTVAAPVGTDGDYTFLQTDAVGRLRTVITADSDFETHLQDISSAVQASADALRGDDSAYTPDVDVVMMSGYFADETSPDTVNEGDAGAARMTLDRKVIVQPQPHTAGGLAIFRSLDLDETEEDVKTSAGQVYGWAVTNRRTSTLWLKFYNATAANVTVGTTTPVITWGIPGNSSDNVAANVMGAMGIAFDTAICVAATTGFADNDTGAPGANELVVNIFYK